MKKLIVNADDFGISEGVSQGILESFREGIVRSTSVMSNMPAFESALQTVRKEPDLLVGVHLNLTCGRPLSPPEQVSSLVSENGHFLPLSRFLTRLFLGRISQEDVAREFTAQIQKTVDGGISPAHLDSHQHIHFHPAIGRVVLKLLSRFQIPRVRTAPSALWKGAFYRNGMLLKRQTYFGLAKQLVLSNLASQTEGLGKDTGNQGSRLLGVGYVPAGHYQEALLHYLQKVPAGVSELVCHPGYVDSDLIKFDRWTEMREEELRAITAPESLGLVRKLGLELS